ncbi:hypothetical protein CPXV_GER1990_2_212 [Cowpox virus]|uniref:Uncharacterized protein n=1 Tax=Cowpox virus TaxID=10243 RepID=G0XVK5_COWPX|nr:hypothetical protein CPXV_GER1990_2_212 [Cowpox virus]
MGSWMRNESVLSRPWFTWIIRVRKSISCILLTNNLGFSIPTTTFCFRSTCNTVTIRSFKETITIRVTMTDSICGRCTRCDLYNYDTKENDYILT